MKKILIRFTFLSLFGFLTLSSFAQTTAFNYQGRLTDGGLAAGGTFDLEFALYDAETGGAQVGSTVTRTSVAVTSGVFSVTLDFGASAFPGADRYLEVRVKKPADGAYTTLTPRQPLASVPYAVRALNAAAVEATTAGDSIVNAINNAATTVTISAGRLPSNVALIKPSATQSTTSSTDGTDAMLDLTGNYTYNSNGYQSNFKINQDGGLLIASNDENNCCTGVPIEGAGRRLMWHARKAAFRAGYVNGTQWDDANIGLYSTAFGYNARALGDYSLALGKDTVAANVGTIALGEGNTATGANSVALGYGASTSTAAGSPRLGTFVFADRSVALCYFGSSVDSSCQFHPTVTNSFNVRAVNGSFFYTNTALTTGFIFNSTTATMTLANSRLSMNSDGSTQLTSNSGGSAGVTLSAGGGSWSSLSDRNMKENFAAVDARDILRRVVNLPISTWNYKTQAASVRHIGAMAQDFHRLFGVGEDDRRIATIDPDGVAFAAIQGLNEELKDRDRKIERLETELKNQQLRLEAQQKAIEQLKKLFCQNQPSADGCQ